MTPNVSKYILSCAAFLLSCTALVSTAWADLRVVSTVPTLAAIAQEIGTDHVDVTSLTRQNQDPHYADARPSLVLEVNKADVLLVAGLGLEEGWVPPLIRQARNDKVIQASPGYFDASRYVALLDTDLIADRAGGDIHAGGNPHFLFDPRASARVALALGDRFAQLDPANAEHYRTNAKQLSSSLVRFANTQRTRFKNLPGEQRRVVSYHRSLIYIWDWLGLQEPLQIEPKPGIPPNPQHVAKVLQTMKQQKIRVIAMERYYPSKTATTLSQLAKAKLLLLDGGVRFRDGQTLIEHYTTIADAIYEVL